MATTCAPSSPGSNERTHTHQGRRSHHDSAPELAERCWAKTAAGMRCSVPLPPTISTLELLSDEENMPSGTDAISALVADDRGPDATRVNVGELPDDDRVLEDGRFLERTRVSCAKALIVLLDSTEPAHLDHQLKQLSRLLVTFI